MSGNLQMSWKKIEKSLKKIKYTKKQKNQKKVIKKNGKNDEKKWKKILPISLIISILNEGILMPSYY